MKTQIIQLEQNEDVISVRDKMNWNQAKRILLVWPKDARPLTRKLDLKLVARYAASLGAQLALVCRDVQVLENAGAIGIPVFSSVRQAQAVRWNDFHQVKFEQTRDTQVPHLLDQRQVIHPGSPAWPEHRAVKIACLAISVLALFILVIFILPSAKISFSPSAEYQSMVFDLVADPQSDSINYATGSLPTYPLEVIVEGRDTIPATGSVTIPEASAKGILHFTNDTERTITIPGGVIVTTSGDLPIRFITTSQVETKVEPYATIDLPAQAMLPGSSGNLYAYELDTIAGELEQYLEVINPDSMTGGTEVRVPSPNEDNFANIRQRLLSEMMQGALVQLQSITPTGDILLSPTLSATEIVNETTFPNIGEPGNDLELSMRVRVEGQVVSAESLHNLITPIMDSYTPDSFSSLGNTLEIIPIKNPTLAKEGKVHWTIRATRQLLSSITPGQITGQVLGKSVSQAVQRLIKTLPLAGTPDIVLAPSWWPCMPFLTMRIQVLQEGMQ